MSTFTYTIALRDNATNLYVTSSIIAPFYPPTSQPFSASIVDNTYVIQTDSSTFTGLNVDRSTNGIVYRTANGRIVTISRNKQSLFEPVLEYPPGIGTEFIASSQTLKFSLFQYLSDTLTIFTPQFVAEILTEFEKEQTNRTGARATTYEATDIILASGGIQPPTNGFRIKTPGYSDLTIFAETQTGVPIKPVQGSIDLGVQRVQRVQADTEKEVTSFQQVDSAAINANAPSQERAKGLDKLGQILQKKGATLQKTLIKAIVAQITAFGISNIKELIEGKVDISKLPRICPTQQKILQLIALRDRYTTQLNTYYTNITGLSKGLTGTQQVSEAIATVITITSATRQAANAALAFVPVTPGAVPSSINILKDLEDIIKPRLDKILKTIQTLSSAVAFISAILIVIIQLLRLLDILIQLCAQDLGVPYQAINTELALLGGNTLSDLQNSTSTVDNTYKGFKFEILQDTANSTKYPLRYAVGKDKYGVILLKSEASFTPNPNILIDELKFIIDRDNLSAE
jgi:hypothetical protein